MKIVKYISVILLLLFAVALVQCSKEVATTEENDGEIVLRDSLSSIGTSCLHTITFPVNCTSGVFTWIINLPQYPDCDFEVSVDYYLCPGVGALAIHMGDFRWHLEFGCPEFYADLDTAYINGTEDQFIIEFNQSVWRKVTENLLAYFTSQNYHGVLQVEYIVGACMYLCGADLLYCGETCCRKVNIWERDSGKIWTLVREGEIEQIGEPCIHPFYPFPGCDPNVLQTGGCFDNCESLDFD